MKKHLFGMALLTCLVVMGGMATAQTIDEIQEYDPVTLAPASPHAGQAVTVTGIVTVIKGTYNSGTFYIQGATGGINFFDNAAGPFALGDVIEVTGTVGSFSGEINVSSPSAVFLSAGPEAVPTLEPIGNVVGNTEQIGNLITVIAEVAATNINGGSDDFDLFVGSDTMNVFVDQDTGIDLSSVAVGDLYSVTGPATIFNGQGVQMKPRFQGDLVENPGGDTVPVIANVNSPNWVIEAADALTVTAVITDDSAITSATLYYAASDGTTQGAFSSVAMSNTGGDNYSGTIPGGHTGSQVDFYVEATDDGAQTVTNPGSAPAAFFSAAVGFTTLYEINTVHPDTMSQVAPLNGQFVNITGVVTAGSGDTGAQSRVVVQEKDPNFATGSYAFGGILMFEGTGTYEYFRGDEVEMGGVVGNFFGLNELLPFNADAVNLIGFGADLPEASVNSSTELGGQTWIPGEGVSGTRWENVWVKTHPAAVVDTLGFGNYIVSTTPARADSVDVAPVAVLAYQPVINDVLTIEGFMTFAGGEPRLVPIADEFIILTGLSAGDDTPTVQPAGGFRSVYPNPFNPMTEIKFVVNKGDLVQLNVYNIRGQKVRTIVQEQLPANEYSMIFDGKTDSGENLASGSYFARLRIGKEVVQVRQMTLVK